jgi:ATP-dependent DNA ligase
MLLLLRTESLPSGNQWRYELKLDGYRAIAFKRNGAIHLRSRNDNDFNARYPSVVEALAKLPDDTVIDGEVVAFHTRAVPRSTLYRFRLSAGALSCTTCLT